MKENICNFCEKTSSAVEVLISDSNENVFICNNCITNSALYLDNITGNSENDINFNKSDIIEEVLLKYIGLSNQAKDFNSLMRNTEEFYDEIFSVLHANEKEEELFDLFKHSKNILLNIVEHILETGTVPIKNLEKENENYDSFSLFKIDVSEETYFDKIELVYGEIDIEYSTLLEEYKLYKNSSIECETQKLLHPLFFKQELDKYVVGQEHSKKTLSIAASSHLKRINNLDLPLPKSNVLLIGPTGSGKTLLIKTISNLLKLPLITVDATSFTSAGYKGNDVSNILGSLYRQSKGETEQEKIENTQKGIVFIDEFDKIKSRPDQYISTERVQQELLKMIEGTNIEVNISENEMLEHIVTIDSSNILFVFSGAFVGLDKIIDKKKKKTDKVISFNKMEEKFDVKNRLSRISSQDLIDYGIIPELIGRIPYVTELQKLSIKELFKISSEIKNSPIELYQNSFQLDNKELIFEQDALYLIAEEAHKLQVGGRGLQNIIDTVLFELLYDVHSLEDTITITRKYVEEKFYLKKEKNED